MKSDDSCRGETSKLVGLPLVPASKLSSTTPSNGGISPVTPPVTLQNFKKSALNELKNLSPSPQLDIQVLIEHYLNINKTQQLLNPNQIIPEEKLQQLNQAVTKRKTGLPVAYITNKKEFFGYSFFVTQDVLIPKPDTEILVERGIQIILEKIKSHPNSIITVCDMCTGSGCIALSVLKTLIEKYQIDYSYLPKFTLVDISQKALDVARKNAALFFGKTKFLDKIQFIRSNLFDQVPGTFDIILTNPPYIPHSMVTDLLKDGRSEPALALDGDFFYDNTSVPLSQKGSYLSFRRKLTAKAAEIYAEKSLYGLRTSVPLSTFSDDGLAIIRNLIPQGSRHLSPKGIILMETGEYNAVKTSELAKKEGFKTIIHKDLEGQLRDIEMFR